MDVVGEGLVARRRGMATLVDHMVPPFKKGGLYTELAELSETISDFDKNVRTTIRSWRTAYAERIRQQADRARHRQGSRRSKLDKPGSVNEDVIHQVENHLIDAEGPEHSVRPARVRPHAGQGASATRTIDAIVSADRSLLPNKAKVLADEMEQRIVASGRASWTA